jgi:hypothetical protein
MRGAFAKKGGRMKKVWIIILALVISCDLVHSLHVIKPDASTTTIYKNWKFTIKWDTSGAGTYVKIRLKRNGAAVGTIFESTPNDGEEEWTINNYTNGTPISLGTGYQVLVKSIATPELKASSTTFQISNFVFRAYLLRRGTLVLPKPDLVVHSVRITPPPGNFHSTKARFYIKAKNNGPGNASGCTMKLWLYSHLRPSDGGPPQGSPPTSPHGSHNEYWTFSVPGLNDGSTSGELEPTYTGSPQSPIKGYSINGFGRYWSIKLKVDGLGNVDEHNEGNNEFFYPFWVPE